jgi:hypothetical protein
LWAERDSDKRWRKEESLQSESQTRFNISTIFIINRKEPVVNSFFLHNLSSLQSALKIQVPRVSTFFETMDEDVGEEELYSMCK